MKNLQQDYPEALLFNQIESKISRIKMNHQKTGFLEMPFSDLTAEIDSLIEFL